MISLLFNGTNGQYVAVTDAGVFIAGHSFITPASVVDTDFCRFGGPSAEVVYIASRQSTVSMTTNASIKWDGTTFAAADLRIGGAGVYPFALEVKAGENRLVAAYSTSNSSRLAFSDPGTPETISSTNFVDLTPGDGERITALASWREMVFAFKETKFFVFNQTSTGPTGLPVFNYRPVSSGIGTIGRACAVSSPGGVYFLARRGIYLTTGGDPVLISRAIDPVFQGGLASHFSSNRMNYDAIDKCALHWHAERLYFTYPSGSATENDRVLVYDPKNNYWTLWNLPARKMCSFRPDSEEELMFTYSTGLDHVGRHSSAYSDDNGVAISSRYQSGFYELIPGQKATTRWSKLWGSGQVVMDMYTDHQMSDPLARGGLVTLGTAPVVAKSTHNKSYSGELFSHWFGSTAGAWSINRIEHDVAQTEHP